MDVPDRGGKSLDCSSDLFTEALDSAEDNIARPAITGSAAAAQVWRRSCKEGRHQLWRLLRQAIANARLRLCFVRDRWALDY